MKEILKENTIINDFSVILDDGKNVKLSSLIGKKGIILYFYPKDLTPGCTKEACGFRDAISELQNLGYNVVGVSADSVSSHQKFKEKYQLNFPLISDEQKELAEYFGVWKEKKMYGKTTMGIQRTTFIIDKNLKIIKVYPKVKVETHALDILADLKGNT
ncbi:MAG: thioredoxin-dependent thiol peroxidase [Leptospiraceae bacterium]|nr:thioredoxin-dependent thiol peroxidase [Leptospiraceae bacterium]MDW7977051.1 thioredoxin-dependent thiol peroxidase [Leptospiraceae bacterium]